MEFQLGNQVPRLKCPEERLIVSTPVASPQGNKEKQIELLKKQFERSQQQCKAMRDTDAHTEGPVDDSSGVSTLRLSRDELERELEQ